MNKKAKMPELIDRQATITEIDATIEGSLQRPEDVYIDKGLMMARTIIDKMPTIEAEPVRHGRWINDTFCSECNRFPVDVSVPISNQELTKYFTRCPHCGAKMNGGAENG